jgi:hypothetical protein
MADILEIMARAIDQSPHNDVREWARAALTALGEAGYAVVKKEPVAPRPSKPLWSIEYEKLTDGQWVPGTAQYDSEFIARNMASEIQRAPGHRVIRFVAPTASKPSEEL